MPLDMTPEQREIGKSNFQRAVGQLAEQEVTRRDFMKGLLAAGAVLPISAAAYFGYSHDKVHGKPVKAALIGAGDEGGVLVGAHNPAYLEFVAVCDVRPSSQKRIFKGDESPTSPRKGFDRLYGKDAHKKIRLYEDYHELLTKEKEVEAVVIALPLNLHAQVSIDALKAGKHVFCEKLMAWSVGQCKEMIRVAREADRALAIGHQRHYSLLYAQAVEVVESGILGDIKHIRALWHRNNTWPLVEDGKEIKDEAGKPIIRDSWRPKIRKEDREALEAKIEQFGFKSVEELIRWRLYHRTGGGLMAELGSHQLDACGLFLGKVRPLAVSGVGGKIFYHDDREAEDHVFVTYEFPGKNYYAGAKDEPIRDKQNRGKIADANDKVVVTYSSVNTNAFEPYGECVMGTRGTMVVEKEENVMLFPEKGGRSLAVSVAMTAGGQPVLDSSATTGPAAASALAVGQSSLGAVSRGYREEMEHFAYCVRMWNAGTKENRPRPHCDGPTALADAVMALTANRAMRGDKKNGHQPARITFQPEWFDPASDATPEEA